VQAIGSLWSHIPDLNAAVLHGVIAVAVVAWSLLCADGRVRVGHLPYRRFSFSATISRPMKNRTILGSGICALAMFACMPICGCSDGRKASATTDAGADVARPSYCTRWTAALRACGFLTGSTTVQCSPEPINDFEACAGDCSIGVSCRDIQQAVCTPGVMGTVKSCIAVCAQTTAVTCNSGRVVSGELRCDGHSDCDDGTDEAGCPTFTCDDGTRILLSRRCDDYAYGCPDNSDEVGCPTFACKDGTTISAAKRCDKHADCHDSSDELECPVSPISIVCI
jgi:hypothetical protein